jgi:hypothetical protein
MLPAGVENRKTKMSSLMSACTALLAGYGIFLGGPDGTDSGPLLVLVVLSLAQALYSRVRELRRRPDMPCGARRLVADVAVQMRPFLGLLCGRTALTAHDNCPLVDDAVRALLLPPSAEGKVAGAEPAFRVAKRYARLFALAGLAGSH